MVNRKGVFIGAYVPRDLKETLQRRAAAEHRTLSQEITRILEEAVRGARLPPGFVDPASGDYTLDPTSGLVDAGDPALSDPDGTRSDIGLFGGPSAP